MPAKVDSQLNLETEAELFAFFRGLCAHFQILLPPCCGSLAKLAMHFSEFLAQERLHTTWEARSSSLLCTFPGSVPSPVTVTGQQPDPKSPSSYCAFPFNFSVPWAILSIPGLKQLSFPAGLPYGGGRTRETLLTCGPSLSLVFANVYLS